MPTITQRAARYIAEWLIRTGKRWKAWSVRGTFECPSMNHSLMYGLVMNDMLKNGPLKKYVKEDDHAE